VLLLLADVAAFAGMTAFWVKMGLIVLLMANATVMMRREKKLRALSGAPNGALAGMVWAALRRHAAASLTLWFAIVLAGTAMTSS
jgi:hypothetical protein